MHYFGSRSMTTLLTVKVALQRVAMRAIQISELDFGVVQGKRTLDQQKRLYGLGRTAAQCAAKGIPTSYADPSHPKVTWTLDSNHLGGDAIDVCPYVAGVYDWDNDGKHGYWPTLNTAFQAASKELNTIIYWGGDWTKPDRPHFSLVRG